MKLFYKIFDACRARGLTNFLPDEIYLKIVYKEKFGKPLNLKKPTTFNEKIQWLKLHDRKPEYIHMVDKYEAKKYVSEIIGDEYIIPTLGVWDNFDDIDFDSLPSQFVLKCTHDSGGIVICTDKTKFDVKAAKERINRSMNNNFFYWGREWPYKHVKPRIIAEKYMSDFCSDELRDYKFFCFGGLAKCYKIDFDRFVDHHANYYDINNNILPFGEDSFPPMPDKDIVIPENIDEMRVLAERLSSDIPFLRADFYDVNGEVYFGELTFYPASGFGKFTSYSWDEKLGSWINLGDVGGG